MRQLKHWIMKVTDRVMATVELKSVAWQWKWLGRFLGGAGGRSLSWSCLWQRRSKSNAGAAKWAQSYFRLSRTDWEFCPRRCVKWALMGGTLFPLKCLTTPRWKQLWEKRRKRNRVTILFLRTRGWKVLLGNCVRAFSSMNVSSSLILTLEAPENKPFQTCCSTCWGMEVLEQGQDCCGYIFWTEEERNNNGEKTSCCTGWRVQIRSTSSVAWRVQWLDGTIWTAETWRMLIARGWGR